MSADSKIDTIEKLYWRFRDGEVEYYRGSEDTAQMAAAFQR